MIGNRLRHWADRFNDLALRDRAMIFGATSLVVVALFTTFFLDPLAVRQQMLSQQLLEQEARIRSVQESLQTVAASRARDPDIETRRRLDELQRELAALEQDVARGEARQVVSPRQVPKLLEDLLARNGRLQLVSLRSLAPVAAGAPSGAVAGEQLIYKHGVEVVVRGSYLDLLGYVSALEGLPWRLYWGNAVLNAEGYPVLQLTLTVYTLGSDRVWMRI
jgi:MSHA biogenesis protein MshJ